MSFRNFFTKSLAISLSVLTFVGCGSSSEIQSSTSTSVSASSTTPQNTPVQQSPNKELDTFPQYNQPTTNPTAIIYTSGGEIEVQLFPEYAPLAVENFITHAKNGYYDGTIFHRVINNFMLQGGDPMGNGTGGESIWGQPFQDEFSDQLYHFRGALSMANSGENTNGSQFFIVQAPIATFDVDNYYSQAMYNQAKDKINAQVGSNMTDQEFLDFVAAEQEQLDVLLKAGVTDQYRQSIADVMQRYNEMGGTPHLDGVHTVFGHVVGDLEILDTLAKTDTDENAKPRTDITILYIEVFD